MRKEQRAMTRENVVLEKSVNFALRIIKLANFLRNQHNEYVLSKQILRSGTSIGANLSEAECAITKSDFLSKIYIAYKECSETLYWLLLLHKSDYIDAQSYESMYRDCKEIIKILSATTKTVEQNSEQKAKEKKQKRKQKNETTKK